jgi:hypothetical protein
MELARVGEKEELIKTITARRYEAKVLGVAYAMAADMYADRRRLIGIPAIVLSTFVGAMTLSSLIDIGKAKLYVDILYVFWLSRLLNFLNPIARFPAALLRTDTASIATAR